MESGNSDNEEKKEKKESENPEKKPKYKIIKNRIKNYIFNIISFLINNKNKFDEKLKPSDIEVILETNSDMSTFVNLKYKTKLTYGLFNPKRDLIKNIKLYREFPAQLETKDEYYSTNGLDEIIIDIYPEIKKGIKLNLTDFPFFTYDDKILKSCDKNQLKKNLECSDKEYIFCAYISKYHNLKEDENPILVIENIIQSDSFFRYFKYVYIIFQLESESNITKYSEDEKIKKYLSDNNNEKKIFFLFNFLSSYKNKDDINNNLINIFQENKRVFDPIKYNDDNKNYFFVLDKNKKIVEIASLNSVGKIITLLLMELKNYEKSVETIPFFEKKEKEKNSNFKNTKKLINFIVDIDKFKIDYLFDIYFKISITLSPNDELTKLKLKQINFMKFTGQFRKKEYNYLKSCSESLNLPLCEFGFTEIPTKDIEVDFNNMECEKCKKIIDENSSLYYCYICKTKYCYECVQSQLKNNKGKKKYIDPKHNLLFFKTRDKNNFLNIDQAKLGNNRFVEYSEDELYYWRGIKCDACKNSLREGSERYLCLCCKQGIKIDGYIDFCGGCIDKMCKNEKERESLEKNADSIFEIYDNNFFEGYKFKIEHRHEKHIYLMMPYQCESRDSGYYNF